VAVTAKGAVAVTYGSGEDLYVRMSEDGAKYGDAVKVASIPKMRWGIRKGPRIAATTSGLVITAHDENGDLHAWRSADLGKTWTGPVKITDAEKAGLEKLHGLAAGRGDTVHVTWLDSREGMDKMKLYAATSTDGGKTWGANRVIYASPDGFVCQCCEPQITADGQGRVAILWRNALGGNRDMYVVRSADDGKTWGTAEKLGKGAWPLDACPHDGGGLATAGDKLLSVWRREKQIFTAALGEEEKPLGEGAQPVVALTADGPWLAWQDAEGVKLKGPTDKEPRLLGPGKSPILAAGAGADAPVVVAWEAPTEAVALRVR
jgi:BNR repeat protein